eukprot:3546865-Amphidinium_carterae.1
MSSACCLMEHGLTSLSSSPAIPKYDCLAICEVATTAQVVHILRRVGSIADNAMMHFKCHARLFVWGALIGLPACRWCDAECSLEDVRLFMWQLL